MEGQPSYKELLNFLRCCESFNEETRLHSLLRSYPNFDYNCQLMYGQPVDSDMVGNACLSYAHMACLEGDLIVLRFLAQSGANLNLTTQNGVNIWHLTCSACIDNNDMITWLLSLDSDKTPSIDAVDDRGRTPLHWAANYTALEKMRFLLWHGAIPNHIDENGATAADLVGALGSVRGRLTANLIASAQEWWELPNWRPTRHHSFPNKVMNTVKTMLILRWAIVEPDTDSEVEWQDDMESCQGSVESEERSTAYPQAVLSQLPEEIFQYIVEWVVVASKVQTLYVD
jgi:hypothetical protein